MQPSTHHRETLVRFKGSGDKAAAKACISRGLCILNSSYALDFSLPLFEKILKLITCIRISKDSSYKFINNLIQNEMD